MNREHLVFEHKLLTTKLWALLHSFFDSKKKIKIPKENASKRRESNKTKVFKRETNENISTSKENKVKVISNKEIKDKAFNSKTDNKISKIKEIKLDADESDSLKKK